MKAQDIELGKKYLATNLIDIWTGRKGWKSTVVVLERLPASRVRVRLAEWSDEATQDIHVRGIKPN